MRLTEASRETGRPVKSLLKLIQDGLLKATKRGKFWEIAPDDLYKTLGLPDMSDRIKFLESEHVQLRNAISDLQKEIALLTDHYNQLDRLYSQVMQQLGSKIKKSTVVSWLKKHGFTGTMQKSEIQLPIDFNMPINQQHDAMRTAISRYLSHRKRFIKTEPHECVDDPKCICHQILLKLLNERLSSS